MVRTQRYWGAILLLLAGLPSYAQNTNRGTDFWTTFTSHINIESDEQTPVAMALYITSDVKTSGTVTVAGSSQSFTVNPNSIRVIPIPIDRAYMGTSEMTEQKGIHITSAEPIVVYSHIYGRFRSGASLIMPSRSLGREYRAVTYQETSQFSVIGVEEDTWIEITPTAETEGGRPPNTPFLINLQPGEVFQVRSAGDLTGSKITTRTPENSTCKKIAVYSGSLGVNVGCGGRGYDNLYQQLFAYTSWGQNYIVVPMEGRPYDIVRILAGDSETTVSINGSSQVIPAGKSIETPPVTAPLVIRASQPISVAQFTPSQSCDPRNPQDDQSVWDYRPPYPGDPDMVILSSIEQNLREITLYSSNVEDIIDNYINVVIRSADVASFTLDGTPRGGQFQSVPGDLSYSYARFRVNAGTHHLAADGGFNAIAYGFGSYESYAYLAGTNLIDFSKHITHETGPEIYTGNESCQGRTVRFSAELDFDIYYFQWDFGDGTITEQETDLTKLSSYEHTYTVPGDYTAKLIIYKSDGSECGTEEELEIPYELQVAPNPYPEPAFSIPPSCVDDEVWFENLSSIADGTEMTYIWDFGDGSPLSYDANPHHRYAAAGNYLVTLTAISKYGCPEPVTQQITINGSDPVADFALPATVCQNEPAWFSDQSTVDFGEITAWHWDFDGEGTSTDKDPVFRFSTPGIKTVTLRAYSGTSCFETVQKEIEVLPLPEPSFTLTSEQAVLCLDAPPFTVTGFSPSDGYQGGTGQLTATAGLDPDGMFHPTIAGAGRHEIFYTFTNREGCSVTVSQTISVGELPSVNAGNDRRILEGESLTLNGQATGVTLEWSPADGLDNPFVLNPRASPDTSITYTLMTWNESGCVASSQVRIEVLRRLRIPNLFTPNEDGANDRWVIDYIEDYPECLVQIYNRFGQRIFLSRGYNEPWDGRQGNIPLPPGTYYYVIRPNEAHPNITGSLTIIR